MTSREIASLTDAINRLAAALERYSDEVVGPARPSMTPEEARQAMASVTVISDIMRGCDPVPPTQTAGADILEFPTLPNGSPAR